MTVSTFFGLQTALRGLTAQQRAIDVTGHNIANASTTGYSRQEAVLGASDAYVIGAGATGTGAGAQLGSGVDVMAYRRQRSSFIDAQYRAQNMRLGAETTRSEALSDAEAALAEPGVDGISAQLSKFWDAWSAVANAPTDVASRQALVGQAEALAQRFASVGGQLDEVGAQRTDELSQLTDAGGLVQTTAQEIARLNGAIATATAVGQTPNDLMDRRDLLLDQLSSLGQISTTAEADGTVTVTLGGATDANGATELVKGTTAATWPLTLGTLDGRLGALQKVVGTIDAQHAALNAVATKLQTAVNDAYGGTFFSTPADPKDGPLAVAVTADTGQATSLVADNAMALKISALRGGGADQDYRALVTGLGVEVSSAKSAKANTEALAGALSDRRAPRSPASRSTRR